LEKISFTPEWLKPKAGEAADSVPVFQIALATVIERDQFDAELEGTYRAGEIARFQLRDVAIEGIEALLGEDGGELVALLQSQYAGEDMSPIEEAKLKTATDILAESWPDYAAAREQEARRNRILPTLAFVRWCHGWDNLSDVHGEPLAYERVKNTIPDAVLRRVPPIMIRSVGVEAYRQQYGQGQAGN